MTAVARLFDSKSLKGIMKNQLKSIKKSKLDTDAIVSQLTAQLRDRYTINKSTTNEIVLKIDKKKNVQQLEEEVAELMHILIADRAIDIHFLFNFIRSNNELIIRVKRCNG